VVEEDERPYRLERVMGKEPADEKAPEIMLVAAMESNH
jgi:hypothetical protein